MAWNPHIFVRKKYHVNKEGRTDDKYYTYDEIEICILKMNEIGRLNRVDIIHRRLSIHQFGPIEWEHQCNVWYIEENH